MRFDESDDAGLTMNAAKIARRGFAAVTITLAIIAAAALLTGCITVPAGTDTAIAATNTLAIVIAEDQESETAEQAVFFAGLKSERRTELFGEMFDAVASDLAETSDTVTLRPEFIAYGFEVEGKIREFDSPLDKWQARGKARADLAREVAGNNDKTLAALKAAQITLRENAPK